MQDGKALLVVRLVAQAEPVPRTTAPKDALRAETRLVEGTIDEKRGGSSSLALVTVSEQVASGRAKARKQDSRVRRPWELLVVAGVIALAAWLRLIHLDLVEFKGDEATAVDLARRLLDGHFPSVGLTSSVGALNPPLFIYLTAVPLAISDDPLAATAFVGLLGVVAVGLTYVVLRPRFGALVALAAAGLFATAPWAVVYGRKIWAQDMLPVFTVSLLWALFLVLEHRRTRAVLFVPVLLCLTFQLNFSALALVVPAAAAVAYRAREISWHWFAAGVGLAVVLLSPWLVHEVKVDFDDVSKLFSEGRGGSQSSPLGAGSLEAIRQTVNISGSLNWDALVGASNALLVSDAGVAWTLGRAASFLAAALLVAGLVTCATRVVRGTKRVARWPWLELDPDTARRALLLAWLGGIWLSYVGSATGRVASHYLIVSYPVTFVVQALALSDVARGRLRPAAAVVAVAVAAAFVAFTVAFHSFLDEQGGAAGDYGIVYRDKDALAELLRKGGLRADGDSVVDWLITGTMNAPPPTATAPVRDHLANPDPLPCNGQLVSFGRLEACLPP